MQINTFLRKAINKALQDETMHICTVIKDSVQPMQTERNKYVFKRDLDDHSDGAYLTSSGIEFQTEEEARENERSPSVT